MKKGKKKTVEAQNFIRKVCLVTIKSIIFQLPTPLKEIHLKKKIMINGPRQDEFRDTATDS